MNSTAMMSEAGMAERRWMRWGAGLLEIRAQREGDKLRLQAHDNGPGLQTDLNGALVKGVGLSNLREGFPTQFEWERLTTCAGQWRG